MYIMTAPQERVADCDWQEKAEGPIQHYRPEQEGQVRLLLA